MSPSDLASASASPAGVAARTHDPSRSQGACRFSVATPTRNALSKLVRCVGSVRGQQGMALEHLVQDAVSGDGTAQWLAEQPDLHWRTEPDAGMYDAIARAWDRSQGEFLSWLNADEQYLPGTLERVASFFDRHPEVDVVFGDYVVCGPDGRVIALRREIPFRPLYVANSFLSSASCTLFFRRRLLERGWLQFDPALRYAADCDLMLNLAARGARIAHLPGYLALFGLDGTNLSGHPRMAVEAELVRQRHGALHSRALRAGVLGLRRLERLARGGYRPGDFAFDFAEDAQPRYRRVVATQVSGRYELSDGAAAALVPR